MSSEPNDESNSQTIDNNVDKVQKVEKPVTETLNEYFLKTKEFVESIDVKESVRVRREQLNEIIEKNVFVAESIKVALHPEAFKKDFMGALTVCSTKLNDKYPYEASLCRSHEYLVIAGAVTIASLPFLKISKKAFFYSAIFAGILGKSVTCVVNHKWKYPQEENAKDSQ